MKKRIILSALLFAPLTALLLSGCGKVPPEADGPVITVAELCREDADILGKAPVSLTYTQGDEAPETASVEVTDPADAQKILELLLAMQVHGSGEYVDMYIMRYEDYCFDFGDECYTLCIIPDSYVSYGGLYYEIAESKLGRVRDIISAHAVSDANEGELSLETDFFDNGDEAPSYIELTLTTPVGTFTGYLEGAYAILSADREGDSYLLTYTYGDFYSHDAVRLCRLCIADGELVIEDATP